MTDYLQPSLNLKYKRLLNLENIFNISSDTFFNNNITHSSDIFVSQQSICNNILCSINLIAPYLLCNNFTCNSSVICKTIQSVNDIYNSRLQVNNAIINNIQSSNIYSNLHTINDSLYCNSAIYINNIYTNNITSPSIIINPQVINIGTTNSIINFIGTLNSIIVSNLEITKKELLINNNNSSESSSGIFIETFNANKGFLQISDNSQYFAIKAPLGITSKILLTDYSDNTIISGSSIIQQNLTLYNSLYSHKVSVNDITINSSLNIIGDCNTFTSNTCLLIANNFNNQNTVLVNNITTNTGQYNNIFQTGDSTIFGSLNNIVSTIVENNIYLNATDTSIISNNSILFISNKAILNNNLTCYSTLYISANANISNNILGNLINSQNLTVNEITVNGILRVPTMNVFKSVEVFCPINIQNLITNTIYNNNLVKSNINILGNACIYNIPEYMTNNEASIKLPVGCLYRTGGILKIRV